MTDKEPLKNRWSRALMTGSAFVNAFIGLALVFLPQEAATAIGMHLPAPEHTLFFQLGGAAYLGFGLLNYTGRGAILGGIYGKAILAGNWIFHLVASITLLRSLFDLGFQLLLTLLAMIYISFAIGFIVLNYRSAA